MTFASARASRGVIGIASESEVLVVSRALRTQLSWTRITPAWKSTAPRVRPWASPGRRRPAGGRAEQPEGFLEDARPVLEQPVDFIGVVEVVAAQDALPLVPLARALDLIERVRRQPAPAHGVVEDRAEDVAVCVARLRRCGSDEHPRLRRATRDDPAFGFARLCGRVRDPLWALCVQGDHAVGASAPVLPGAGQLVGQALGLGLGRDLHGGTAGWLSRPARDLHPADILAFGLGLLRGLLAQDATGLEVREVGAQATVGKVADRSVGAVVAVQPLEDVLVARDGGALEALLALALSEPSLGGLPERAFKGLSILGLRLGLQVTQDLRELGLGVLWGQMLRCRARSIARAPDGRPARRLAARVADMRRTEATSALLVILVAPERIERPGAAVPVELDLKMPRGACCIAHDA